MERRLACQLSHQNWMCNFLVNVNLCQIKNTNVKMTAERIAFPDDPECKDLGTETEAEKQIKRILEKQLSTKVTLQQQFQQHRTFTKSGNYVSINEIVSGSQSLQDFKSIEQDEFRIQELMKCGLTEEEIDIYLSHNGFQLQKKKRFSLNPDVLSEKLDAIMEKIHHRHTSLNQEASCTGLKQLTRHEMEIEKTLYAGCQSKEQLKTLLTVNRTKPFDLDGPYKYIDELAKKINSCIKKKRKRRQRYQNELSKPEEITTFESSVTEHDSNESDKSHDPIDPSILHAVVPLEDTVIRENKLSLEELRQIPRFHNYDPGEPSQVLYLKNLHPKIDIREMISLFERFSTELEPPEYRLLTGRMRGQAFVKFQDTDTARKAFELINGYKLRGKPIVIEFGKKTKSIDVQK